MGRSRALMLAISLFLPSAGEAAARSVRNAGMLGQAFISASWAARGRTSAAVGKAQEVRRARRHRRDPQRCLLLRRRSHARRRRAWPIRSLPLAAGRWPAGRPGHRRHAAVHRGRRRYRCRGAGTGAGRARPRPRSRRATISRSGRSTDCNTTAAGSALFTRVSPAWCSVRVGLRPRRRFSLHESPAHSPFSRGDPVVR